MKFELIQSTGTNTFLVGYKSTQESIQYVLKFNLKFLKFNSIEFG